MCSLNEIREKLTSFGQTHLLKFYEELDEDAKLDFLNHLNTIDYEESNKLFQNAMKSLNTNVEKLDNRMKPIPSTHFEAQQTISEEQLEKYNSKGLEEISENHVAVLLMAGGQGTRLGVSYPKGLFSVGIPSGKTLFRVQAERINRLLKLAQDKFKKSCHITWYIMTSAPTFKATKEYLTNNKFFGLKEENVKIFKQGLLPCFDFEGKIFLEDKNKIALAPDGNGGIYKALATSGIIEDMKRRGILYVHAHSVDNILVKVADPVFIGYCVSKNADCAAKVVRKAEATEAVGVVCLVDDTFQVVEYSEITEETANLKDEQGNLVFNAGNICNHFFSSEFLCRVAVKHEKELKLHVAKKKIPHIDDNGEKVKPTTANGIKIEKFIFDVFKYSTNFVTWEVPRETEFSALKNADDAETDCPTTARGDLFKLHKGYIEKAGGFVDGDQVEISPLLSYAGEGLEQLVKGKRLQSPVLLLSKDEK